MATTPTQNEVPSESPRDLKFNAGKIDQFVTSIDTQYVDRKGVSHYTINGINELALNVILSIGYVPIGTFQDGGVVTNKNQILKDEETGEYYRWDGDIPKYFAPGSTPETSGGIGAGAWVSVGDSALRSELAKPGGAGLIGGLSKPITFFGDTSTGDDTSVFSVAELSQFNDIYLPEGFYTAQNIQLNKRYWGPGVINSPGTNSLTFSGSGLNDLQLTGVYNGSNDLSVKVRIKTSSTPDTLEFSADGGVTWTDTQDVYNPADDSVTPQPIPIVTGGVSLFITGVKLLFNATTGHTVGNTWSFKLNSSRMILNTNSGNLTKGNEIILSVSGNNDTNTSLGKSVFGAGKNVGPNNTGIGWHTLYSNTTGYANTSIGLQSMESNTTGKNNCAYGADSLRSNLSGGDNVAIGVFSCGANTTGYGNTGAGNDTNRYNETGFGNTATGVQSLYHNKAGNENVAVGEYAMRGGSQSLPNGTSAQYCVGIGAKALYGASSNNNTAVGYETLYKTTGTDNAAVGMDAGFAITSGSFNTIVGSNAGNGTTQSGVVSNCVLVGDNARSTGSNAIAIGSAVTAAANTIVIGNASHSVFMHSGKLSPAADNAFDIGSPTGRYKTVYATTGTINTSNELYKTPLLAQNEKEKAAALQIKKEIRKFKFIDSVNSKGEDNARWHFGVGAQTVGNIMRDNGLNPEEYGFWCHDKWNDEYEEVYEYDNDGERRETGDLKLVKSAGETFGIRYDELCMFILSAI